MRNALPVFLVGLARANPMCWGGDATEEFCCYPLKSGGKQICWEEAPGVWNFDFCCGHLVDRIVDADSRGGDGEDSIAAAVGVEQEQEPPIEKVQEGVVEPPLVNQDGAPEAKRDGEEDVVREYTPAGVLVDDDLCLHDYMTKFGGDYMTFSGVPMAENFRSSGMPNHCLAIGWQYRWVGAQLLKDNAAEQQTVFGMCVPPSCSGNIIAERMAPDYIAVITRHASDSYQIRTVAVPYTPIETTLSLVFQHWNIRAWLLIGLIPVMAATVLYLFYSFCQKFSICSSRMKALDSRESFYHQFSKASLQKQWASLTTEVRFGERNHAVDVLRSVLLGVIIIWHSIKNYQWALSSSQSYLFNVLRGPLTLGNSGYFFLSGYLLSRQTNLSVGPVTRKLFRQLPILGTANMIVEFGMPRAVDMGNRFLASNPFSLMDCNKSRSADYYMPWSIFPIVPGGRYCTTTWAWAFEMQSFCIVFCLLLVRNFSAKVGNTLIAVILAGCIIHSICNNQIMWPMMSIAFNMQAYLWAPLLQKITTSHPWKYIAATLVCEFYFLHIEWVGGDAGSRRNFPRDFDVSGDGLQNLARYVVWNLYRVPMFIAFNSWLINGEAQVNVHRNSSGKGDTGSRRNSLTEKTCPEFGTPGSDAKAKRRSANLPVWPPPRPSASPDRPSPSPRRSDASEVRPSPSPSPPRKDSSDESFIKAEELFMTPYAAPGKEKTTPVPKTAARFSVDSVDGIGAVKASLPLWTQVRYEICHKIAMVGEEYFLKFN